MLEWPFRGDILYNIVNHNNDRIIEGTVPFDDEAVAAGRISAE